MRRANKIGAAIVILVAAILVILPGLMNAWVKNSYYELIDFYNSQHIFNIQVKAYHQHWYSADTEITVEKLDLPQIFNFTVKQHINYGPIIFSQAMPLFKLATVHSQFQLSSATAKIVQADNTTQPMLELEDNISFTGKYQSYFHANGFKIIFPTGEEFDLGDLTGVAILKPFSNHIKGSFKATDLSFKNPQITITVPELDMNFNERKTASHLWIGDNIASIKSIMFEDEDGKTILVSGLSTTSDTSETAGKLTGKKHLTIDAFQFNDIAIGPLDLQISVNDLNASKAAELFSLYQKIYYSPEKMPIAKQLLMLFPSLITPESTVTLDSLQLNTVDGNVSINGKAQWPLAKPSLFQTPTEFFQGADARGYMRISTSLAKQLLSFAADLRMVAHRMTNPHLAFIEAPKSVDTVMKQYSIMMALLVQGNQLTQATANQLTNLQEENVSLEDYTDALDKLAENHQISATAQKMLRSQYESIQLANLTPEEKLQYLEGQFEDEFYGWVKQGYVKEEGNDYVISVTYQQGKMLLNGKAVD